MPGWAVSTAVQLAPSSTLHNSPARRQPAPLPAAITATRGLAGSASSSGGRSISRSSVAPAGSSAAAATRPLVAAGSPSIARATGASVNRTAIASNAVPTTRHVPSSPTTETIVPGATATASSPVVSVRRTRSARARASSAAASAAASPPSSTAGTSIRSAATPGSPARCTPA